MSILDSIAWIFSSVDARKLTILCQKLGIKIDECKSKYDDENCLIELSIYHRELTSLPPEIGNLTNLRRLTLSGQLTGLPSEIGNLINLQYLNISGNKLITLPPEIGNLINLEHLNISGNQLVNLPPTIGKLTKLKWLDIKDNQLTLLPPQIGNLTKLSGLELAGNQLVSLFEISSLTELHKLTTQDGWFSLDPFSYERWPKTYLNNIRKQPNPALIGFLTAHLGMSPKSALGSPDPNYVYQLDLSALNLTVLPTFVGELKNLQILNLSENKFTTFPNEILQLTNLQELNLTNNQLTILPPNIGLLVNLRQLTVDKNPLPTIPLKLAKFGTKALVAYFRTLSLEDSSFISSNEQEQNAINMGVLTAKLGVLPKNFKAVSPEQVTELDLSGLGLEILPPYIAELKILQILNLSNNKLTLFPTEILKLTNLQNLDLQGNKLTSLPVALADLNKLQHLNLEGNLIHTLPAEVINHGTSAILAYLRELQKSTPVPATNSQVLSYQPVIHPSTASVQLQSTRIVPADSPHYEAKLLFVGEGRMGKTSLVRALLGQPFDPNLDSTHGIEIKELELGMMNDELGVENKNQTQNSTLITHNSSLTLHMWDFGGQSHYQTTHQFFFSQRSLYVVAWNGGMNFATSGVETWLKNIQGIAPQAPILLVATHLDQRAPRLDLPTLKRTYPQIVGLYPLSNKDSRGLAEFKQALAEVASQLPHLKEQWPTSWLATEQALRQRPEPYLSLSDYVQLCAAHGVEAHIARTILAQFLHDLGKMLYFQHDDRLRQWVVLQPNWLNQAIYRLLDDEATQRAHGVLAHADLARLWGDSIASALHPTLLHFMSAFDLRVEIPPAKPHQPVTHSLIPMMLAEEAPPQLPLPPDTAIEFHYQPNFMPPDLLSWFIVRSYRYTTHCHWRKGVILKYGGQQARLEQQLTAIHLWVWGDAPHNFFNLLRETLANLLTHFETMPIKQLLRCTCQPNCPHFHDYDKLVARLQANRLTFECPESGLEFDLRKALYGLHAITQAQVSTDLMHLKDDLADLLRSGQQAQSAQLQLILQRQQQLTELSARQFARHWNLEAQKMEAECPNLFLLSLAKGHHFDPRAWFTKSYRLHLLCQNPTCPHLIPDDEGYELRQSKEWWAKISPWLKQMLTVLQYTVPAGQMAGLAQDRLDQLQQGIDLLNQMDGCLPEVQADLEPLGESSTNRNNKITGPALRALHGLLGNLDPNHHWGGLHKTLTPDGNILWLCDQHRREYSR